MPKDSKKSKNAAAIIESVEKLTVLELSDLVSALEEKFGVSAAPIAAASSTTGPAGVNGAASEQPAEEKTEFDVVLSSFGENKINVIKTVRVIKPDIGLSDAKKLVEAVPAKILEKVKKEEAEQVKKKLEEAGGKAELK